MCFRRIDGGLVITAFFVQKAKTSPPIPRITLIYTDQESSMKTIFESVNRCLSVFISGEIWFLCNAATAIDRRAACLSWEMIAPGRYLATARSLDNAETGL